MAEGANKFNLRNPAVKRIMQEIKEIKQDTSGEFLAEALENDIFEWHFVIRGPRDTEFEGGVYHGRILLPAEYPFKPPSFMMLTPNGRWETNVKICLSISSHHPEHWQPSWSVRTALTALIAFMPSPGAGALGALDFTKDERRALAAKSRAEPPRFGSADRQRVIEDMHARMLDAAAAAAAAAAGPSTSAAPSAAAAPAGPPAQAAPAPAAPPAASTAGARQGQEETATAEGRGARASGDAGDGQQPPGGSRQASMSTSAAPAPPAAPPASPSPACTAAAHLRAAAPLPAAAPARAPARAAAAAAQPGSADHVLTALMWALYVGIGAILLRKVMGAMGLDLADVLQQLQGE